MQVQRIHPRTIWVSEITISNFDNDYSELELDDRLKSGFWSGFWLQKCFRPGRIELHLDLTFRGGDVSGEGRDCIGVFSINGTYKVETGEVDFIKKYSGAHEVIYNGFAERTGSKGIWGVWYIRGVDSGDFHVWCNASDDSLPSTFR